MSITLQTLAVIPLVMACGVYSAWALMPAAPRRRLAVALGRLPWARRVPAIARAAREPVGCGCDGCDRSTLAGGPRRERAGVIRIVAQRPRP